MGNVQNGNIGYLEVLLEAESFSDFISRIEMIKTIMEYDYELLNTLEEKKREVEDKKLEIEKEQERILTLKNKLERKAKEVKSLQVSRENKIRKIDNEIVALKEMKHLEEDAAKVKKIIQAAIIKQFGGSGPYTGVSYYGQYQGILESLPYG